MDNAVKCTPERSLQNLQENLVLMHIIANLQENKRFGGLSSNESKWGLGLKNTSDYATDPFYSFVRGTHQNVRLSLKIVSAAVVL